jgi:hypothetical protein
VSRLPAEGVGVSFSVGGGVKIHTTTLPRGWDKDALCRDSDTDIDTWIIDMWDGRIPTKRQWKLKKEYCDKCPIKSDCKQFGKETQSTGLFGGVFLDEGKTWSPK